MSGNPKIADETLAVLTDIKELSEKIDAFKDGRIHEERFKHFRLTRGVYGQRQLGVHMFRTKIPYGKLTAAQLIRLADVSDKYTNGNLTLRQGKMCKCIMSKLMMPLLFGKICLR